MTDEQAFGAGVGVATIGAVLEGDRRQVEMIHELYGATVLIASLAAAERLALQVTGPVSTDCLFGLADQHQQERSYLDVVVRRRDRFGGASAAVRYARRHAKQQLQQYFRAPSALNVGGGRPAPRVDGSHGLAASFGASYATALTVVHLARVGERDWTELLGEMRCGLAQEWVLPPGVQPPA